MTITAVVVSMALLLAIQAVAEGMFSYIYDDIRKSKIDISISGTEGYGMPPAHDIVDGHQLAEALEDDPEVKVAAPLLADRLSFKVEGRAGQSWAQAEGIIPDITRDLLSKDELDLFPKTGTIGFNEPSDPHYEGNYTGPWTYEVVIDENTAKEFGLKVGDPIFMSQHAAGNYTQFNVTGIMKTLLTGEGTTAMFYIVILHLSELQHMLGIQDQDRIDGISCNLRDDIRMSAAKVKEYKKKLEVEHPFLNIITKEDRFELIEERMSVVRGFYIALGGVSLLIGLLFVMTIMIMSVIERTGEIGMMRAIGLSRRSIFRQIMGESLLIVISGSLIGIIPGYALSKIAAWWIELKAGIAADFVQFTPLQVGQLFVIVILLGTLVSLIPSYKATSMNITESISKRR
jgi:ABC-type lipoprotein release transport system permease subunit